MAGQKAQDALRKQKEARQKKVLLALLPILLLLLVWQGPATVKAFTGGDPPPPAPVATPAPATAEETGDATATAAPSTATDAAVPSGGTAELVDTDVPAEAAAGQLLAFDRFVGKDPFKQQVVERESSGEGSASPSTSKGGGAKTSAGAGTDPATAPGLTSGSGSSGGVPTTPPNDAPPSGAIPTSATVDVNGTRQTVAVGVTFPAEDPIFRVVSIAQRSMKIELVTGEFSDGRATLTLKLRRPLTLVSQPDGVRYVVKLLATGTAGG